MNMVYNKSSHCFTLSINATFLIGLILFVIFLFVLMHYRYYFTSYMTNVFFICMSNFVWDYSKTWTFVKNKSGSDFKTGGIKNFRQTKIKFQLAAAAKHMVIHDRDSSVKAPVVLLSFTDMNTLHPIHTFNFFKTIIFIK